MDDAERALAIAEAHNPGCLGCGTANPATLAFATSRFADGRLTGTARFSSLHDGAPGRTHGGALAAVLDEAMGRMGSIVFDGDSPTARLEIDYRRPAVPGVIYAVEAWILERDGRKLWMAGEIRGDDGPLALAKGLFVEPRPPATIA